MSKEGKNNKDDNKDPFGAFQFLDDQISKPVDFKDDTNDVETDDDKDVPPPADDIVDDVIDEGEEDTDPVPTPPKDDDNVDEVSPFKAFASHFAEKGLLEFDEETFEDSEEGLEKVLNSTIENKVKAQVGEFFESMPDELRLMAEFVANGGDPKQFIEVYYNNKSVSDIDISDDNNQKLVVSKFLELTGYSQEEIQEALSDYEYSGILEKEAKRAQTKLIKAEEEQKKHLVIEQKKQQEQQAQAYQEYLEGLKTDIEKREDLKGFKLSPSLKNKLYDHITKPITKDGKTQLQLNHEKNPDSQLIYAYLDLIGWDISKLEKQVQTKVTSNLKANLGRFTDSKTKVSKGSTEPSLPPDFGAFKSLKF
jgi:hypothetical protein